MSSGFSEEKESAQALLASRKGAIALSAKGKVLLACDKAENDHVL